MMAPTVVRDGQFRLFFFSREEARIHVHISYSDGEAKFWLTPQVAVATYTGLTARQLRGAQAVVERHLEQLAIDDQSASSAHRDIRASSAAIVSRATAVS
jgi:hypothetical protein